MEQWECVPFSCFKYLNAQDSFGCALQSGIVPRQRIRLSGAAPVSVNSCDSTTLNKTSSIHRCTHTKKDREKSASPEEHYLEVGIKLKGAQNKEKLCSAQNKEKL
ncbi:hypothetical protein JTE90_019240 [Oedothorax gibbosus]|uniref:Uncharacterized protein n=1 Tax=Oedothorax gibbosus TaxID=931172 RepID=A0AAV6URZ5_9ARAC|nr:hypothetical protein JTE90_019240 [Oedothorax gibbosus]